MSPRINVVTILALAAAATLAACGGDSEEAGSGASAGAGDELSGATFVVGSKDFTESILLGKITAQILEANGATVEDKTNIVGSVNTREAMVSGDIDMYWEYTGTAWITYQGNTTPIADPVEQYEAVKEADAADGIAWLDSAPMNNTYAFAIRSSEAEALGVATLSDLAELTTSNPEAATFCIESEFSTRDDGFPGLVAAYGMTVPDSAVNLLDTGVIYSQTAEGKTCNFGEVFATDGRIAALDLTVLEDDKQFFPNYNAALTLKQSMLDEYPTIAEYINPVAAKLDNATMTSLNAKVDAEGEDPNDVATEWLTSEGFIS